MTTTSSRRRAARIDTENLEDTAPFETEAPLAEEPAAPRRRRPRPAAVVEPEPVAEEVDDDDEEEEEAPAPKASRRRRERADEEPVGEESLVIPIARGRKAIKDSRPQSEAATMFFRWADDGDPQVVKFFDEDPWSYNQHWITREGKQSFPCIARPGVKCPLCDLGQQPTQKIVYSLINLSHRDGPTVQVLEVGPSLDETLIAYNDDRKTGPLDRLWWSLSRTKGARGSNSRAKYNYLLSPIKDRDLDDDWNISLKEAEAAVAKLEPLEPEAVLGKVDQKMLQEIASEAMSH